MNLDPVSLRLFVSVIEEGTISAAAQREHIAAAAVSKRLSELEEALGLQLMVRSNKGITPTQAGISLLYLARGALNNLNDIVVQMRDYSDGRRGSVRVLANISAINQFLPALFKSFMSLYPLISITLEERESLAVTRGIAEKRADIGVFTHMPHGAQIEVLPFRSDRLVVLVPKDHPLASETRVGFHATLDYPFVALKSGTHLNFQMVKAANDLGRTLKLRMEVSSYDALCLMVDAGIGIGVLPQGAVQAYNLPNTRILALDEPWASRELALCVSSRDSLSVAAHLLLDHLLAEPCRSNETD